MSLSPNQFALLRSRRFLPFFITQFLGALNDNIFKNAFIIALIYRGEAVGGLSGPIFINLAGAVAILPYILFSSTAGALSDVVDKGRLMQGIKALEILIMLLGAAGFVAFRVDYLLATLFLLGVHSAFFGPAKYALLPQHLEPHELVGGNGLVESGTFVAILLGTLLGGGLVADHRLGVGAVIGTLLVLSVLGFVSSLFIPPAPPEPNPPRWHWNPFLETWQQLCFARHDRMLWWCLLANSWFWFFGAVFLTQFAPFARDTLHGDEWLTTFLLATLSLGVGVGSLLCERLCRHGVALRLIAKGLLGMGVFALLVVVAIPFPSLVPGLLFGMGLMSGLYIVPLYTLIQSKAPRAMVSRMIAVNNVLNALAIVLSSFFAITVFALGGSIPLLFALTAILSLAFLWGLQRFSPLLTK